MKNLTINKGVKLQLGVILLCTFAIIYSNWHATDGIQQDTEKLLEQISPFQIEALNFRFHAVQIQQWLTDISATRGLDGLDDGFDQAADHFAQAKQLIAKLQALDPGNQEYYVRLGQALEKYYETGQKMAKLYVSEGPSAGNKFMTTFDKAAEQMGTNIDTLLERTEVARNKTSAQIYQGIADSRTAVLIGTSILALIGVVGIMLILKVIKPLDHLVRRTQAIAEGDLHEPREQVQFHGELAELDSAVSSLRNNLRHSLREIETSVGELNQAVAKVNRVAENSNSTASEQRSQIEQVATAINEMVATVQEISRNTTSTADAAGRADQEVGKGRQVVAETIRAIEELATEVVNGVDAINRLKTESETIGSVLDVIRGIAEQTNLLALNAAIEAARAGEQGRGFAVVADEVRTLASRTAESTNEIQKMIEQLQAGASTAANVMQNGKQKAQATTEFAESAGRSLEGIRQVVGTIHDMTAQIATAAEEQSVVSEEINRNIHAINNAAEHSVEIAAQASITGDQLTTQSGQLRALLDRFST